jgi:SAM-dependent methyltransferase
VIGVDSSPGMLEVCRERAELAGVAELLDLRLGELESPPVEERVALVTCPFRSYLHLLDDKARLRALSAARALLVPGGRLVFDVFAPGAEDIAATHGRWLEREPGIFERADWDSRARTLTLSVRGDSGATTFTLAWLSPDEWRACSSGPASRCSVASGGSTAGLTPRARTRSGSRGGRARRARPGRRRRPRPTRPPAPASRACRRARPAALAQLVHAVARVADHRDLEERLAGLDALADRPLLHVGALDGQVLADRPGLDADRVEVLARDEQHLALRAVAVGAALHALAGRSRAAARGRPIARSCGRARSRSR